MKELFLLKLGEIVLKGQNRRVFEDKLKTVTRRRMTKFGEFKISIVQSTLYVEPLTEDQYNLQVRSDVAAMHLLKTLPLDRMVAELSRKSGNILNISSMNAYIPLTKIPAYSGAKAAISNFTQWLATHFAGTGIRANAIAPGFLVSNQNRALLFNADGTPTARSAKILNGTPMGRFVDSKELLGGVFFLTDDEAASAITGVVLPIDCGFAAYSGV